MDEPGRLPDAGPRQCPRRVQSHRARLQSSTSPQYRRRRSDDRGRSGMTEAPPSPIEPTVSACPSGRGFRAATLGRAITPSAAIVLTRSALISAQVALARASMSRNRLLRKARLATALAASVQTHGPVIAVL